MFCLAHDILLVLPRSTNFRFIYIYIELTPALYYVTVACLNPRSVNGHSIFYESEYILCEDFLKRFSDIKLKWREWGV